MKLIQALVLSLVLALSLVSTLAFATESGQAEQAEKAPSDGYIYLVTPCRLIDTRFTTPVEPPNFYYFLIIEEGSNPLCGLDPLTTTLIITLTVVNPPTNGAILLDDANAGAPDLAKIWTAIYKKGRTRSLGPLFVKLDYGRFYPEVKTFLWAHSNQRVDIVVDVVGYVK